MQKEKAISDLAVFVLQNKRGVISLINRLRIASLPLDAPIIDVNEVVIDNIKELEPGFLKIANNGYSSFACAGVCIGIIVAALVITSGVAIQQDISRNMKMREEIFRIGFRSRYLNKETLNEIAFLQRKEMQKKFLYAQQDYLQREENMIQENREATKNNSLYLVLGGAVALIVAIKILNK